ncbi:DUF3576 domain-containing protein [Pelagibacteraceae bacterium]|nr:DUF3576 domain-containing protein [Pelagibacteraceae bacterium]
MKIILISSFLLIFLVSCAQIQSLQDEPEVTYKTEKQRATAAKIKQKDVNLPPGSTLLDPDAGFTLRGALGIDPVDTYTKSITFDVALDKISFMPLLSVDSMSGVIVTDWYSIDEGQSRIKINIRIVDQEMTDESVVVSLFSQSLDGDRWIDQGINSEQGLKIKESILSSARSLKIASEL